ncbi:MAG: CPBP family intramembrane glutamic endopeptidase [Actinomycetota bacterium]
MAPGQRVFLAIAGFMVGIVVASLLGSMVVAAGGWQASVPATIGSEAGRTVRQLGQNLPLDDNRIPAGIQALLNLPLWLGLIGAPLWARRHGLEWVRDMGWGMTRLDVVGGLTLGVVTQFALIPLYELVFVVFGQQDVAAPARSLVAAVDSPLDLVALVFMTVIAAPVAEEICYRGLLYRGIRDMETAARGAGVATAMIVSSVIFAASHFQLVQFPGLLVFGLVAAVVTERTGRLGTAIWTHVGFNLAAVVSLLLA